MQDAFLAVDELRRGEQHVAVALVGLVGDVQDWQRRRPLAFDDRAHLMGDIGGRQDGDLGDPCVVQRIEHVTDDRPVRDPLQ